MNVSATGDGDVIVTIGVATIQSASGVDNIASTSADNSITIGDHASPALPVIHNIITTTDPVTGAAEPGSIISLTGITCDNAPVITDAAGNWNCDVTGPLTASTTVTGIATDQAGNQSEVAKTMVTDDATTSDAPGINMVDNDDLVITGTATAGAVIDLAALSCDNAPVVADAAGNWSCDITSTGVQLVGSVINVTATESGKATSPASSTTVIDNTTVISPPVVNPTNGAPVTGSCEVPNATVKVFNTATATELCSVTANGSGAYSCPILTPVPTNGDELSVICSNPATGESSPPTTAVVDQTNPAAPVIFPYIEGDSNITGTAEPGGTLDLSPLICSNAPVIADTHGNWSCTPTVPPVTGDSITAVVQDEAGNDSDESSMQVVGLGTVPPPAVNPSFGSTASGTGIVGYTVTVTNAVGQILCTATVDSDGNWQCALSPVATAGDNLRLVQTDTNGLYSVESNLTVSNMLTTGPLPPFVNPSDGTQTSGKGLPGNTILVADDSGNTLCTVVVLASGDWSCTLQPAVAVGDTFRTYSLDTVTGSRSVGIVRKAQASEELVDTATPEILTGLEGRGAGSLPVLLLMTLVLMLRQRRTAIIKARLSAGLLAIFLMSSAQAGQGQWYVGGSLGLSELEPDTNTTGFTLDDDKDTGYKLALGYDITDNWTVEGFYADLGSATLLPNGSVDYDMKGLGIQYYYPASLPGWAGFIKAGLGQIGNDGNQVSVRRVKSTQVYLGAGVEYQLDNNLAIRGEFESYDDDARFLSVGLIYRFGSDGRSVKGAAPVVATPEVVKPKVMLAPAPIPVSVASPAKQKVDTNKDDIVDSKDSCPFSKTGVLIAAKGCSLSEVVYFKINSAQLTRESSVILDQVAVTLSSVPTVRVEVQGYTDRVGKAAYNQKLSEKRAVSVRQYLISRGVSAAQLSSKGYGESAPITSNMYKADRVQNRRVELKVLKYNKVE